MELKVISQLTIIDNWQLTYRYEYSIVHEMNDSTVS